MSTYCSLICLRSKWRCSNKTKKYMHVFGQTRNFFRWSRFSKGTGAGAVFLHCLGLGLPSSPTCLFLPRALGSAFAFGATCVFLPRALGSAFAFGAIGVSFVAAFPFRTAFAFGDALLFALAFALALAALLLRLTSWCLGGVVSLGACGGVSFGSSAGASLGACGELSLGSSAGVLPLEPSSPSSGPGRASSISSFFPRPFPRPLPRPFDDRRFLWSSRVSTGTSSGLVSKGSSRLRSLYN